MQPTRRSRKTKRGMNQAGATEQTGERVKKAPVRESLHVPYLHAGTVCLLPGGNWLCWLRWGGTAVLWVGSFPQLLLPSVPLSQDRFSSCPWSSAEPPLQKIIIQINYFVEKANCCCFAYKLPSLMHWSHVARLWGWDGINTQKGALRLCRLCHVGLQCGLGVKAGGWDPIRSAPGGTAGSWAVHRCLFPTVLLLTAMPGTVRPHKLSLCWLLVSLA